MKQTNMRKRSLLSLSLKWSALLILLLTSSLLVACSSTGPDPTTTNLGAPPATVTITLNTDQTTTALPTQTPYQCGAWITDTSPGFIPGTTVPIYAHFVHLVNGNPQGIPGATAQATVYLANGSVESLQTTTGSDGLAVFAFRLPNDITIANHNNLVTVTFTGTDGSQCTVDQNKAAYFTPLLVSPAATATKTEHNNKP